jgi:16S rRNA processing protein RimM
MVVMGRVATPYGVKGWVNVLPDTEYVDGLFDYPVWWINTEAGWKSYQVETAKIQGDHLVVKFEGLDDRDLAFKLKGRQVGVARDELPPADDDEYYWSDLIGVAVENTLGESLGTIQDVFATGANDVLVVKNDVERLIPFVDGVVISVDIINKKMQVDWGLDY